MVRMMRRSLLAFTVFTLLCSAGFSGVFSFRLASHDNTSILIQEVDLRIDRAIGRGRVPVIVFDLDDTLFLNATRNTFYLHEIARRDDRFSFLFQISPEDFIGRTWDQWTQEFLQQLEGSSLAADLARAFSTIKDELRMEGIAKDELVSVIAELAHRWALRARIVYLTAREDTYTAVTRARISGDGLPMGRVVLKGSRAEKSFVYKGRRLPELVSEVPEGELVATIDDEQKNASEMNRVMPFALHLLAKAKSAVGAVEISLTQVTSEPLVVSVSSRRGECAGIAVP